MTKIDRDIVMRSSRDPLNILRTQCIVNPQHVVRVIIQRVSLFVSPFNEKNKGLRIVLHFNSVYYYVGPPFSIACDPFRRNVLEEMEDEFQWQQVKCRWITLARSQSLFI